MNCTMANSTSIILTWTRLKYSFSKNRLMDLCKFEQKVLKYYNIVSMCLSVYRKKQLSINKRCFTLATLMCQIKKVE